MFLMPQIILDPKYNDLVPVLYFKINTFKSENVLRSVSKDIYNVTKDFYFK